MKDYKNKELGRLRKWQRKVLAYRKLWEDSAQWNDRKLHEYLDSLGVPRSAYGYENVTDGSYARIRHFVEYLQGKHPIKLDVPK